MVPVRSDFRQSRPVYYFPIAYGLCLSNADATQYDRNSNEVALQASVPSPKALVCQYGRNPVRSQNNPDADGVAP